jgi:large subunit ribosomal protein L3
MGADKMTVRGLKVVAVDPENNVLLVQGAVPGPSGGVVTIQKGK